MAVRLPTLTAAVAPVAVGIGVAIHDDVFAFLPALMALVGAICLQIGANFANDAFDFKHGADTADRLGPPRATQMGLISSRQMLIAMWIVFALAALAGVYLVAVAGWPIVAVGLGSIAGAIIYTGGPWPIGYHALGDVFTFVFFGLVAVMGTYYAQAGEISRLALFAAIPVGCTVTLILVVNNLRDIDTDHRAGKTTLAVILGERGTRAWYFVLFAVAYAVPLAVAIFMRMPWVAVLVAASLPWGHKPGRAILAGIKGRALNPILKATAQLNLVFGLLWGLALAIS